MASDLTVIIAGLDRDEPGNGAKIMMMDPLASSDDHAFVGSQIQACPGNRARSVESR